MTDFKVGDKVKLTGEEWGGDPSEYGLTPESIQTVVLDEYDHKCVKDSDGYAWFYNEEGYEAELVESATDTQAQQEADGWTKEAIDEAAFKPVGEVPDFQFVNGPKSATQELEERIKHLEKLHTLKISELSGEIENLKSAQSYADIRTDTLREDHVLVTSDLHNQLASAESRLTVLANDVDKDREKATADTLLLSQSVDDRFAGLNHPLKALILAVGAEKFSEAELTIARLAGVDALTGTK